MTDWHQRFADYYADILRASAQSSGRSLTRLDRRLSNHLACDLEQLDVGLEEILTRDTLAVTLEAPGADELSVESDESGDESKLEDDAQAELDFDAEPPGAAPDPGNGERLLAVRAGRKIQRSQTRDPYNRETLVGGPVVMIRRGDKQQSGPLLYWEVELDYHPGRRRLTLTKRSALPEVNVLLLESFLEEREDVADLVSHIDEDLQSSPLSRQTVDAVMRTISGLVDGWEEAVIEQRSNSSLRASLRRRTEHPTVLFRGALIHAPRSHAVLLEDLRRIADLPAPPEGSPLDVLTRPEDPDLDPNPRDSPFTFSDTTDGGAPLWYPFESNPSQRKVGHMVGRAKILTVEGPPGTGKSRTISNLVCHLAASGHSVLVTSHQRKAVEVVADFLKPLPDLALSLIEGDRESAQRLHARIEAFLEKGTLSVGGTEREVQRGMEALHECDRSLRTLAHRFQELNRKENEAWEGFQSYEELRCWNKIPPDDSPASDQVDSLASTLPEWCERFSRIRDHEEELRSFLCPDGADTPALMERRILQDVDELIVWGDHLEGEPTGATVQAARHLLESAPQGTLQALLTWIRGPARRMVKAGERVSVDLASSDSLERWRRAREDVSEGFVVRIAEAAERELSWFEGADPMDSDGLVVSDEEEAELLTASCETLRSTGGRFLTWHLGPRTRKARQAVEAKLGNRVDRARWSRPVVQLEAALTWRKHERYALAQAAEVQSAAPTRLELEPPRSGSAQRIDWIRHVRRVTETLKLLRLAPSLPSPELWGRLSALVDHPEGGVTRANVTEIDKLLSMVEREFRRHDWLREFSQTTRITGPWVERLTPALRAIREGKHDAAGRPVFEWLRARQPHLHDLSRMRELERGELRPVPGTLVEVAEAIRSTGDMPGWIQGHVEEAVRAHRLHRDIEQSLGADPDDITSVSSALKKGEQRRREILFELIGRRHRMYQAKALQKGNLNAELQRVRQLLKGPKRMRKSLVTLREQIDYSAVLKAFPAWICTIDDAARLFPAEVGLFDYVIVDEASQCAQPAILPLAIRSQHLVVVGDEKQLKPSFARFLPTAKVKSLRVDHGLDEHRAGLFTEGKGSLLSLASYRSTAKGFLDEHFRCDPAIIAWSNARYYGDRLKILTHRRPRPFSPPLQLIRLEDADDDPEEKRNRIEADAVVRTVRRLVSDPQNVNLSIGVISPFRQQADLVQGLLEREFEHDPEVLQRHQILASTADGFQGDERDIILYSFRMGPSSNPNSLGVLEREEERFNVAFSRAKRLCISFLSCAPSRLPSSGVTRSWIQHTQAVVNGDFLTADPGQSDHFDSEFERKVCQRLRDRGLRVTTQVPCGNFRIDLVARDAEGRTLAVECDGEWKRDALGQLRPEDYQRQDILERAGWTVHRISGRRYLLDPIREIEQVIEILKNQATEKELAVLEGDVDLDEGAGPLQEPPRQITPTAPAPAESPAVESSGDDEPEGLAEEDPAHDSASLSREERRLLVRLVRWSLQGSHVKATMFDRLVEIDGRLKKGESLEESDHRALKYIRRLAEREGFDPTQKVEL